MTQIWHLWILGLAEIVVNNLCPFEVRERRKEREREMYLHTRDEELVSLGFWSNISRIGNEFEFEANLCLPHLVDFSLFWKCIFLRRSLLLLRFSSSSFSGNVVKCDLPKYFIFRHHELFRIEVTKKRKKNNNNERRARFRSGTNAIKLF